jgi:hypothetical protein
MILDILAALLLWYVVLPILLEVGALVFLGLVSVVAWVMPGSGAPSSFRTSGSTK